MSQANWEKSPQTTPSSNDAVREQLTRRARGERAKYLIGAALLLGSIAYLLLSGTLLGARYYITVDEVVADPKYQERPVRLSGVVLGETIVIDESDPSNTVIQFTVANVPENTTNLAEALYLATLDTSATRLKVYIEGQPRPELLRHEAQAILTGTVGADGVFYATQMNFKCPSRFEEGGPQIGGEEDHPGRRLDASEVEADAG
jgi:cytochrome c-type biogenesis protein CcmE